jgi:hypothetical protein
VPVNSGCYPYLFHTDHQIAHPRLREGGSVVQEFYSGHTLILLSPISRYLIQYIYIYIYKSLGNELKRKKEKVEQEEQG